MDILSQLLCSQGTNTLKPHVGGEQNGDSDRSLEHLPDHLLSFPFFPDISTLDHKV